MCTFRIQSTVRSSIAEVIKWPSCGVGQTWDWALIPGRNRSFSSSLQHSDWVWVQPPTTCSLVTENSLPGGTAVQAWSWSVTLIKCWEHCSIDLHLHPSIRLHGIVLHYTQGQFVLLAVICYGRFWIVMVNLMLEVIQNTLWSVLY